MDGAGEAVEQELPIRSHTSVLGPVSAEEQLLSRAEQADFQEAAEGERRIAFARRCGFEYLWVERLDLDRIDTASGDLDIAVFALDPDPTPVKLLGHCARRAAAEERVENDIVGLARGKDHPADQRFRLLGRG